MAKIDIAARTPGIFKTNRRKCGWGAALTTCDICGKIMMGHNRGICSKCMKSGGLREGDTIFTPQRVALRHILATDAAVKRAQAQTMRDTYANGGKK